MYEGKGDIENALVHHQKGLEIKLKLLGSEHPLVAASLNNLGIVYFNMGNRAAATEMNTKSYHIYLKVLGPDYPDTQLSLRRVGQYRDGVVGTGTTWCREGDVARQAEVHGGVL